MEFLDSAVIKAKEVIDVACKKTSEAVSSGKQRLDVMTLESKLSKDFEKLGIMYYAKIKEGLEVDETTQELAKEIRKKRIKIKKLKTEIKSAKNTRVCPGCGLSIDEESIFCSACGAKLEFED